MALRTSLSTGFLSTCPHPTLPSSSRPITNLAHTRHSSFSHAPITRPLHALLFASPPSSVYTMSNSDNTGSKRKQLYTAGNAEVSPQIQSQNPTTGLSLLPAAPGDKGTSSSGVPSIPKQGMSRLLVPAGTCHRYLPRTPQILVLADAGTCMQ